jgi:hypothetical protein
VDEAHELALGVTQLMCGMQPRQRIVHDARYEARRQPVILIAQQPNQTREGFALDVVHYQENAAGVGIHFCYGHDIRMANARGEPCLFQKVEARLFVPA